MPNIKAKTSILMDYNSGKILHENEADMSIYPKSTFCCPGGCSVSNTHHPVQLVEISSPKSFDINNLFLT